MNEFKNKVVIVTGGLSGIGKAIAEMFNSNDAKVVVIDRDDNTTNCDYYKLSGHL